MILEATSDMLNNYKANTKQNKKFFFNTEKVWYSLFV